ncbi:SAC3 domain containing protein [Amanita muscaria]
MAHWLTNRGKIVADASDNFHNDDAQHFRHAKVDCLVLFNSHLFCDFGVGAVATAMETVQNPRTFRGRGVAHEGIVGNRRPHSRNKQWVAPENGSRNPTNHVDSELRERGGHRNGAGRGSRGTSRGIRRFPNVSLHVKHSPHMSNTDNGASDTENLDTLVSDSDMEDADGPEEPELESQEEREKFYQELVKAREVERKRAIAEGKMDDPSVPKRLEDAITMVGTCLDMCPRFERYRRERENNLFEWETLPGTKRVDHKRAVKMYERAAGDKTLPSDLRPPHILKASSATHLFWPFCGFHQTFNFIRDRTRAVRNDFTMQHQTGSLAIECHDRCARFHILALHFERKDPGFSVAMEEQQLMNTLQSLKEFYEDQRGRYQSPTELEMRVYHRLIHIRDQRERPEDIPASITEHPVFKLTTTFRLHVQKKSAPIRKNSPLVVDQEGMQIFAQLAGVLREQGSVVMIYLVACILERLFGPDMIEDIEGIRGDLSIPEIIDGVQTPVEDIDVADENMETDVAEQPTETVTTSLTATGPIFNEVKPVQSNFLGTLPNTSPKAVTKSVFSSISSSQSPFGTSNVFGGASFGATSSTAVPSQTTSAFTSVFGGSKQTLASIPLTAVPSHDVRLTSGEEVQALDHDYADTTPAPVNNAPNPPTSMKSLNPAPAMDKALPPDPTLHRSKFNPAATTFVPTSSLLFQSSPSTSTPTVAPQTPTAAPAGASADSPLSHPTEKQRRSSLISTRRPSMNLPKINTAIMKTNDISPLPAQPPPPPKIQPISLPSTPTTAPLQPSGSSGYFRLGFSSSRMGSDILSPLPLLTGGLGPVHNFSPFPSPAKTSAERKSQSEPSIGIVNGKGKGKEVENGAPPTHEQMEAQAIVFEKKSIIVKQSFERWKQRAISYAAWLEACRQSDSYRRKVQLQRQVHAEMAKKRRLSTGSALASDTTPKKRIRGRVSADYRLPRTDDQLAQRLKENHEEHAHRWARGSFLRILKSHINEKKEMMPSPWKIWLSTNPDSDATAIWMERKFDVPDSGYWSSENIFSIPTSTDSSAQKGFPGVIIFECTPIQNVKDDIERKYHILDDCARLRDIVKALPSRRHYIPSLLLIRWADAVEPASNSDLSEMVQKLVNDSIIGAARVFNVTSDAKNLDTQFTEALADLKLDTTGQLVEFLTIQSLFKRFGSMLDSFASEWMENSIINGEFDWTIYGDVAKVAIQIVNDLTAFLSPLLGVELPDHLPPFNSSMVDYSDAAYESAHSWLSELPRSSFVQSIIQDLQSHQEIGQEFPARLFLNYIMNTALYLNGTRTGSRTKYILLRADLTSTLDKLKASIQSHQTCLNHALNKRLRRSPKRRGISEETEESISVSAKRRRLSGSANPSVLGDAETVPPSPLLNGRPSPSPSVSTMSLEHGDQVTVAMLRSLTKELKRKYVVDD